MANGNGSEITKSEALEKLQRLRSTMTRYREEAKRGARMGLRAAAGMGGAVASGAVTYYRPYLWEGSEMPTDAALAVLLGGAAFMADDQQTEDGLLAVAIGMGAPALSRATADMLRRRDGGE